MDESDMEKVEEEIAPTINLKSRTGMILFADVMEDNLFV